MNQTNPAIDPQTVMQSLRAKYFTNNRHHQITRELDRLLQPDQQGGRLPAPELHAGGLEARGLMVVAKPGDGKTTAVHRVLSRHPALQAATGQDSPRYIRIQVPSPATLKSLGRAILGALGMNDVSERAPAWDIWRVVKHRLSLLGIVVLWIDEAQDVFLSRSAREIDDMLKTLKSLMQGDQAVVLVLSGTDRLLEVARYDQQVDRRFRKIMSRPLVVGHHEQNLQGLIDTYCQMAGIRPDIEPDTLRRLIHGSRGLFGRAIETILAAIEQALYEESCCLKRSHFAEAWSIQEGCSWDQNVFEINDWAALEIDSEAEEFDAERTRRQHQQVGRG